MFSIKLSAIPSMVAPLGFTVRLLAPHEPPSERISIVPVTGLPGNVTVNGPPDVSAI